MPHECNNEGTCHKPWRRGETTSIIKKKGVGWSLNAGPSRVACPSFFFFFFFWGGGGGKVVHFGFRFSLGQGQGQCQYWGQGQGQFFGSFRVRIRGEFRVRFWLGHGTRLGPINVHIEAISATILCVPEILHLPFSEPPRIENNW